uniref:Uncharacterized protein n=1 Tax=Morchella importuna TaxID=1174673 RepID=A0A650AF94_9PEZI|nr:hypothetical protein [Morchella importuna]QGN66705.1 hypothetical protein [Morchella importuna]
MHDQAPPPCMHRFPYEITLVGSCIPYPPPLPLSPPPLSSPPGGAHCMQPCRGGVVDQGSHLRSHADQGRNDRFGRCWVCMRLQADQDLCKAGNMHAHPLDTGVLDRKSPPPQPPPP